MPAGAARTALEKNSADFEQSVNRAEMAHLAADVYGDKQDPALEGWKRIDPKDIPDPKLQDPQLWRNDASHFRAGLYQSTIDPTKYTVATAGSSNLKDFGTDGMQAFGAETKQYDDAIHLSETMKHSSYIQNMIQNGNLQGTGHSLGGGEQAVMAPILGVPSTTMNAAGVHPETLAQANLTPADVTTVTNLEVPGQIVNTLQGTGVNVLAAPFYGAYLAGADTGVGLNNAATRGGNFLQNSLNKITGQPTVPMPTLQKYPANQTWRTVFPAAGKQVMLPDPGPATSGAFKHPQDAATVLPAVAGPDMLADSVRRHLMAAVETSIELDKTAQRVAIESAIK